jgi:hypothetical protein
MAEVVQRKAAFMAGLSEAHIELDPRDSQGDLPRARIAETAGAQGDVALPASA